MESHEGELFNPNILLRRLFLDDTVPDMSDQWCAAYFKRFKLEIGNILKEACSLPDGDGRDVEP